MSKPVKRPSHSPEWVEALPKVLANRILLCACERQVPLELPLMVSLAGISASVGAGVEIRSGKDRSTRANLYVLLGVSSGIGKSEIFRDLVGPINQFESSLHQWWEEEPATKARAGEELLKARVSAIRSDIRKYPMGDPMLAFRHLQASQRKRSICQGYLDPPSLLADDSTSEALAQLMHRSRESIATVSADARYLLKRLRTPDTKEESFYLKAFSGDLALTNRISRNSIRLRRPCLTALLLTQRDAYRSFISKALINRSGLLPRFLHAEIQQSELSSIKLDRRTDSRIRNEYAQQIAELIEAFRFERDSTQIDASPKAERFLQELEQTCREKAAEDEGIAGEVLRRRAEQCWRVGLCLHLARYGNSAALHALSPEDAKTASHLVERFTQLTDLD